MIINEVLLKTIEDSMNLKGLSVELSSNFKEDFFEVQKEIENKKIRTYINADTMNSYMFLYTFAEMLRSNEVNITFNENASEKHVNYLKKLSKSL